MGINTRESHKQQVRLSKYVKDNGFTYHTSMVSKKEIIDIFRSNKIINNDFYISGGKRNDIINQIHEHIFKGLTVTAKRKVKKKKSKKDKTVDYVNTNEFLKSYEWRKLRYQVLQKYERRCMCCGNTPETGAQIHVDHIKPRRKYPELARDINNLQLLCHLCNHGKGNWDETDYRNTVYLNHKEDYDELEKMECRQHWESI